MSDEYTFVPNVYVDEHLAELSGAETKVLLAIIRRTFGEQKDSDEISIEQLQQMTGLARNSVRSGLRGLLERGLIAQTKSAEGIRPTSYKCVIPRD